MSLQMPAHQGISPLPSDPDVHLSVLLHGVRFDYAACMTAALVFIQEHQRARYTDAVSVCLGPTEGLRRLPNERLYMSP